MLNAMFCNEVTWNIARYGFESFGLRIPEFARKTPIIFSDWNDMLRNSVSILEQCYQIIKRVIKKAELFIIEITEHDFDNDEVVKEIVPRPTAYYAHARVRIRLRDELLQQPYEVKVEFEIKPKKVARCEVCLWDKYNKLTNDLNGSPKDFIYIKDKGSITVKAGKINNIIVRDIEPRVWLPGKVKRIKVKIKKLRT